MKGVYTWEVVYMTAPLVRELEGNLVLMDLLSKAPDLRISTLSSPQTIDFIYCIKFKVLSTLKVHIKVEKNYM